jgi:hypothetical protein
LTTSGNSQQGEGSARRGLPHPRRGSTSWRQTGLFPPALVQVRLDVGWAADDRVGMSSIEAYLPHTKELIALEVHPSARYLSLQDFLTQATAWQHQVLLDCFDPPPF